MGSHENSVRLSYLQLNGLYLNSWAKPIRHTTSHVRVLFSPSAVDATYMYNIHRIYVFYMYKYMYHSRAPTN